MSHRWDQIVRKTTGLALLAAISVIPSPAAPLPSTAGTLVGVVADPGGVTQMGATVLLFNRFEKLVHKALTDERGHFGFDHLVPDVYTVRVSLSTFVPAIRQGIDIKAGMRSFLSINLASVLSSVEVVYSSPNPPRFLSDDWKWVLRSSMSTRPVLRFLPGAVSISRHDENVFTNTRGVLRVSAGDTSDGAQGGQPDVGTGFALATSMF